MLEAFALGALGQTSLVLAGLVVYAIAVPRRIVGALAGFGAGSLLGAIAFDLVPDAEELPHEQAALWLLAGAATFVLADRLIERMTAGSGSAGGQGPDATGGGGEAGEGDGSGEGGPLGIVVGSVVDGVPESIIFGIGVATGQPLSIAFLAAVWISNIPQALAPSAELAASGWKPVRLGGMWLGVVLACGLAAAVGYLIPAFDPGTIGAGAAAFGAGGLIAMLTDSLIPFSYQRAGAAAGVWAVVGFALALAAA